MSNKLSTILQEVTAVQSGQLRFRHREIQQDIEVKVAFGGERILHCVFTGQVPANLRMRGKKVHLIQRHKDDYLFVAGYIIREVQNTARVISIDITKASWFVQKRRGDVSWLREMHTYQSESGELSAA